MNTLDLLSYFPPVRDWSPDQILASPAWAMPCRLGPEEGRLVSEGALLPVDPLRLAVRFAADPATLCLADSPLFPELHALWPARAEVPAPILLALVEKECGPLLQLLENAAGRELAIDGLAEKPAPEEDDSSLVTRHSSLREARPFVLRRASGETLCTFALTLPPPLVETFGALRNLDVSHLSICDLSLPAVVQIASPVLSAGDLETLAPGDHILLPEVQASSPGDSGDLPVLLSCPDAVLLIDNRLAASSSSGLAPWSDSGAIRIVLSDSAFVSFGELADLSAASEGDNSSFVVRHSSLHEGVALALLRGPATLATGRLSSIAKQLSFAVETTS